MKLSRDLWPGKGAWVAGGPGRESRRSRHLRRAARERAIERHHHQGLLRRAISRARRWIAAQRLP